MAKYIVHYTQNCTPKVKVFAEKKKAELFVTKLEKNQRIDEGTWFDFLVKGELVSCDGHYKKYFKKLAI